MASARGHFVWHELLTSDVKGAIGFYGKVAGWTTQGWGENQGYIMFMAGKSAMGGVLPIPADAQRRGEPRHWLPYVGTEDVEVAVWEAQRLGGKVIRDTETMPSAGKFAVLEDPWGAVFAVIQPENQPSPKYPAVLGDFSWHELVTKDTTNAFRFYSALFGWQKTEAMDMGPDGVYQEFGWKGRTIGGMYKETKPGAGPRWVTYIKVRDARASAEVAKKAGGQIRHTLEVPGGDWISGGLDPQGAEFALHSATKKAAKKKPAAKKRPAKKPAKRKVTKVKKAKRK